MLAKSECAWTSEDQCLLLRIRPYLYGFSVVCTDIRELCSIIRKSVRVDLEVSCDRRIFDLCPRAFGVGGLCSQICLLCYSIMLTNSTHYAFISAHIMLEYPNRITGQENNYANYLTFIIIFATSVGYGSGSWILGLEWILGTRTVIPRLYVRPSLCETANEPRLCPKYSYYA